MSANATERDLAAFGHRAARNHTDWFTKQARVGGMPSGVTEGVPWAASGTSAQILFPELDAATAGATLDAVLADLRATRGVESAGCWSLLPAQPPNLGAMLFARGFGPGWQPWWMRLDLRTWVDAIPDVPGLVIKPSADLSGPIAQNLPYYGEDPVDRIAVLNDQERVWYVTARAAGKLVGKIAVSICEADGSAGVYSCGVAPRFRNRGIGAALTAGACRIARDQGCEDALLNATPVGARVYSRVGFEHAGEGQTWWLHADRFRSIPPARQSAFVEAIGSGDLERAAGCRDGFDLDQPLPCGLTLIEVAVDCDQPAAVDWLAGQGATLDIVSCWDLGWRERAAELLESRPELANLRRGEWSLTPLHVAVERDDADLLRLVLAAHPDLGLRDTQFDSTPLGWAENQGRDELAAILRSAE